MNYSILSGLAFIWCIFACGCNSNHLNNTNQHNLDQYHLGEYTNKSIDKVNYTTLESLPSLSQS